MFADGPSLRVGPSRVCPSCVVPSQPPRDRDAFGTATDEPVKFSLDHRCLRSSSSSSERGQSSRSSRLSVRSANSLPPAWHCGQ